MKVVLDSSFLLEILLDREYAHECKAVTAESSALFCISIITVHLCYYFLLKEGISISTITRSIAPFTILESSSNDLSLALEILQGDDFEDALQVAIALNNRCDIMYTLDKKMRSRYSDLLIIRRV
ncbi:MAG: type II toxin-antitoxin system VapC family toxin [Candidatus Dojkabacteria bacterium]